MATVHITEASFGAPTVVHITEADFTTASVGVPARVRVAEAEFFHEQIVEGPDGAKIRITEAGFYFAAGGLTPGQSLLAQWDGEQWLRLPVVTWDGTAWVGAS